MSKHKSLRNFTQEQQALNNIADMLNYLFEGDLIKNDQEAFDELTQRTLDLMKQTDSYEHDLREDPTFLKTIAEAADVGVEEVIDDLTYVLLHSALAKQSIVIERLASMLDDLPQTD